jgi:tetratricopeptide (TPR) repeat protein
MNQFKYLFILLLFAPTKAGAVNVTDSLFIRGNEFYIQRQYDMAEQCYSRIIRLGYESAGLYFNLGNALYKQDKLAAAILYYEKALLLKPGDEDIKENLSLANSRIIDKIDAIPEFFIKRWIEWLRGLFAPDTWAIISIILFMLALAGFLVYYISFRISARRTAFTMGIAFGFLWLLSAVLMITRIKTITEHQHGIIMLSSVIARSSPDTQSTNVFVLHEGTKVAISDSIMNWKEIRIADGNTGWVPKEAISGI